MQAASSPTGPDLLVQTRDGRQIAIEVKWAGEGWPDDVRRVARDIPRPWPQDVVVVARDPKSPWQHFGNVHPVQRFQYV